MKPKKKKKFNIKAFFVLNVEKFILILVIPAAIYLAYQGTQHEPLSWQPDVLAKAADVSDEFIKNNVRKAVDEGVSIFTYDQYAEWIKQPIKDDLYRTDVQWLPSLFPEKNKRGSVPVFTATDLKASSGLGAVAINPTSAAALVSGLAPSATGTADGMGGSGISNLIGARWAVVTGLIPVKKQLDVYVEKYTNSVLPDPVRDMPTYVFYDVERAEIEPGKNINDLEWVKLELVKEYNLNTSLWSGIGQDVVDPDFLAPPVRIPMAYPLPPVSKKFGEEVAHPPVIPMLSDSQTELLQQLEKVQQRLIEKSFDIKEGDVLDGNLFMQGGGGGGIGGTTTGGLSGFRRGQGQGSTLTAKEEEELLKPVDVTHYLFRYLDFKVEPGKTYRYRARLYLANPNYDLAPNYIEDESLSKENVLVTDYSEASNMVTIPLESRILTTGVTQASMPWTDPSTNVTAVYFDMKDGSEWYVEKNMLTRGSLVNFKRQEVTNPQMEQKAASATLSGESLSSPPSRGRTTSRTRKPEPKKEDDSKKTLNIVSEVCVLDITGGIRLPKATSPAARDVPDMFSPGRVVVLEPSGNMVIRTINADRIEMENIKNPKQSGIVGGHGGSMMGDFMDGGSL